MVVGSLGGVYMTMKEIDDLMQSILKDYKDEIVFDVEIGKSHEGRPIMAYAFMLDVKP